MKERTKRIVALGALLTTLLTVNGCSNNKDTSDSEIGYIVEATTDDQEREVYSYIIDNDKLVSTKNNLPKGKMIVKVVEREEYGTTFFNKMTAEFYAQNLRIVLPDSYRSYDKIDWYNSSNFDIQLICEKLQTRNSSKPYVVISSFMTAKKYLYDGEFIQPNEKKYFQEGDNMSSIAIYYDDELVGFKQMGVGSECENVTSAMIGDVDLALSLIEESKVVSSSELLEIEDGLNKVEHPKEYRIG